MLSVGAPRSLFSTSEGHTSVTLSLLRFTLLVVFVQLYAIGARRPEMHRASQIPKILPVINFRRSGFPIVSQGDFQISCPIMLPRAVRRYTCFEGVMNDCEFLREAWRTQMADIADAISECNAKFGCVDVRALPAMDFNVQAVMVRFVDFSKTHAEELQQPSDHVRAFTQALGKGAAVQIEQLQEALNGISESYARIGQGINTDLFAQVSEAAAFLQTQMQDMWAESANIIAEAMTRTRDALTRVELLAALGWTLPMDMSLPEVQSLLMQQPLTVEGVE